MIKNYIFDFGQVIVNFDTEYLTSIYVKEQANIKIVEKTVFDRCYWDKLDAGTITDIEVKRGFCSRLPKELQTLACDVYDNWYKNLDFIEGMPELLQQIKENGGNLYILSNISLLFAENYLSVPKLRDILSIFDGLVFSAPLGITKPDEKIYEYLLRKYNLRPEESVFIDDNINNVVSAQNVGINAFQFNGNIDELAKELFSK